MQLSEEQQKLGKMVMGDKWEKLTYWQKMCEIADIQIWLRENPISTFFGIYDYKKNMEQF